MQREIPAIETDQSEVFQPNGIFYAYFIITAGQYISQDQLLQRFVVHRTQPAGPELDMDFLGKRTFFCRQDEYFAFIGQFTQSQRISAAVKVEFGFKRIVAFRSPDDEGYIMVRGNFFHIFASIQEADAVACICLPLALQLAGHCIAQGIFLIVAASALEAESFRQLDMELQVVSTMAFRQHGRKKHLLYMACHDAQTLLAPVRPEQ